ncbi:DUF2179 domain-containing protein, partial [Tetragenococcus halophilus]|uniref:DUF2179 domain-containing protein n=1 Tax=Tetragenococcus halophilus TaxID=51669 RepID=UPI0011AF7D76
NQNVCIRDDAYKYILRGAYTKEGEKVLFTIVTRYELPLLRQAMKESDKEAFVSITENVQILGNFYEEEL